eukprot:Phypoly_transcript_07829.p1 GENE.Phypoly_transcript_07829~~Phypoly_transcript_07829.p1  ORF type:complete len:421 (+),score=63.39 Phypoly_transcript_07829:166-1428(+)
MSFAITNVRIFDGDRFLYERGHILVQDGLIAEVSPLPSPSPQPPSLECIDGDGCTLLPGLIDAHVHAFSTTAAQEQSIAFGITTILDLHNEPENNVFLKKEAARRKDIADIRSSGLGASVEGGWPATMLLKLLGPQMKEATLQKLATYPKVKDPADAEAWVVNSIAAGSDYIKLFHESGGAFAEPIPVPTPETQKALIEAAHKHGIIAVCHIHTLADSVLLFELGVDGLTHTFIDRPPTPEVISLAKRTGAFVIPTLATMASQVGAHSEEAIRFMKESGKEDFLDSHTKEKQHHCYGLGTKECKFEYALESVRQYHQAGVDILCGSDAMVLSPGVALGLSVHHELSIFVEKCGFTPSEALRSATALVAKRFRLNDRGRLEKGLLADLLLVRGDPTKKIQDLLAIEGIWRGGVRVSRVKAQ